jgi:hypothetical protein
MTKQQLFPLSYSRTELRISHSALGLLSVTAPLLLILYCAGIFGKAWLFLFFSPAFCVAAIGESLARRMRVLVPIASLLACFIIAGSVLLILFAS